MVIPGRSYTGTSGYRYGFNGKEMDNDTYGQGNEYDYGFRIYNPRIGRFLSIDPLTSKYPWYTPYQFAGDNPILFIDFDGLEPATTEQKKNAWEITNQYRIANNTQRVFQNVSKISVVADLFNEIYHPEKSTIPVASGWYCGLYAFAYAYVYYDPEGFTKGVLDLVQNGTTTTAGGQVVTASESLRNLQINSNISVFIFTAAVRETFNNFLHASTGGKAVWAATACTDMVNMLTKVGNLNVKEFSYGHETIADGITNDDIGVLKKHLDNKNLAILRVSYNQFKDSKDEFGSGMEATFSGGDHWIVLQNILEYDIDKNTITVDVYDDHGGLVRRTFELSRFKDMIYHVFMIEKKISSETQNKKTK